MQGGESVRGGGSVWGGGSVRGGPPQLRSDLELATLCWGRKGSAGVLILRM